MKKNNRETGAKAEAIACWFLKQQGYDVLEQNFYTKVGEIDIIAKEDQGDKTCILKNQTIISLRYYMRGLFHI